MTAILALLGLFSLVILAGIGAVVSMLLDCHERDCTEPEQNTLFR